jgi:hypothetical protein
MAEPLEVPALHELARRVGKVRSGCLLVAWMVEMIDEHVSPAQSEARRMELYEGMTFMLETLATTLDEVYGKLYVE